MAYLVSFPRGNKILVENCDFSYPCIQRLIKEVPVGICHNVWYQKTRMCVYLVVKKSDDMCSHFNIILACDRSTDGHLAEHHVVNTIVSLFSNALHYPLKSHPRLG